MKLLENYILNYFKINKYVFYHYLLGYIEWNYINRPRVLLESLFILLYYKINLYE